jgi:hypothetical protein
VLSLVSYRVAASRAVLQSFILVTAQLAFLVFAAGVVGQCYLMVSVRTGPTTVRPCLVIVLEEVAFFDMPFTNQTLRKIYDFEKLSVKAIRLIGCHMSDVSLWRLLDLCNAIEGFEYTINHFLFVESPMSRYSRQRMFWSSLLKHKASLRRLILADFAGSSKTDVFLGDLREFRLLQFLEVDQDLVLLPCIQGALQVEHFPKSLKTLKLHKCTSEVVIKVLGLASDMCWPQLAILRLTCLPLQKELFAIVSSYRSAVAHHDIGFCIISLTPIASHQLLVHSNRYS